MNTIVDLMAADGLRAVGLSRPQVFSQDLTIHCSNDRSDKWMDGSLNGSRFSKNSG